MKTINEKHADQFDMRLFALMDTAFVHAKDARLKAAVGNHTKEQADKWAEISKLLGQARVIVRGMMHGDDLKATI